jgi:1-acyl-sn-glycerol-3-phosphate acyltransferase
MPGATTMSSEEPATVADVVRSCAFYALFYFGTIFYVTATLVGSWFGERPLRLAVRGWAMYHRFCTRFLLGIRVRVEGELPDRGVIVALKHESFFEAIDIPGMMRHPVPFPKAELAELPGWGRALQRYGAVVVEREEGAKALRKMIATARVFAAQGRPLAIFPEGTRVPTGQRPALQAGFAGIYKLTGLPVVPVPVNSGRLYHRKWKKPGIITLKVGEPIPAGLPRAEVEARVHEAINALNA